MSDFPQKDEILNEAAENTDEFSTVFSAPEAHKKNAADKAQKKKRWPAVIAAFAAVAVLAGSTVAIVKLIPEKEEDSSIPEFETIKVLELSADDCKTVTVKNKNGTFKLYSEEEKTESSDDTSSETATVNWYLEGYDKDVIDSYSAKSIVNAAAVIEASREITEKTEEECGLNAPVSQAELVTNDDSHISVLIGAASPDKTGTYLKLSTDDKIYLVEDTVASAFEFTALDLAATNAVPAVDMTNADSSYKDDDGALTSFDTITVSGKNFPKQVVIEPNNDNQLSQFAAYLITAPTKRIADNTDAVINLFKSGLSVSGACSFDTSAKGLAAVGLDKPDFETTIKLGKISRTYKFKQQEDGSYAVWYNGCRLINTVSADSLEFINYEASSFYAGWVALQSINDLSNFTLKTADKTYSFDIVYDDSEDAEETYVITYNGTKLVAQNFQNFYQQVISLTCTDFTTSKLLGNPDVTLIFSYTDKSRSPYTVEFRKASETRYQYSIDGIDMGKVTSSSLLSVLRTVEKTVAGEEIK